MASDWGSTQKHVQGTGQKIEHYEARVSQLSVVVFTDQHGGEATARHACWLVSYILLSSYKAWKCFKMHSRLDLKAANVWLSDFFGAGYVVLRVIILILCHLWAYRTKSCTKANVSLLVTGCSGPSHKDLSSSMQTSPGFIYLFIFKYLYIFILCVWVTVCLCVCVWRACLVPTETRRGCQIPMELEL